MIESKIQWTECTHNFWSGCKKVSAGCKFCYMYRLKDKHGDDGNVVRRAANSTFFKPYYDKVGKKIFTCSMSDFFIEEADQWRDEAWQVIRETPQHTWLILTKRPERVAQCLPKDWGEGYSNVWLGVSVENQKHVDRIDIISKILCPVHFISAEPLLDYIDLKGKLDDIDWVIIGGESGNDSGKHRYRACEAEWMMEMIREIRVTSDAKVFVKQMGTYLAKQGFGTYVKHGFVSSWHGDDFQRFPIGLQIREMPDDDVSQKAA